MKKLTLFVVMVLIGSTHSEAKTVRATEVKGSFLSSLNEESVLEFRQGDEFPLTVRAVGDLLESSEPSVSQVRVKRTFWLRMKRNDIHLSFDGTNFSPIKELLEGSLSINASSEENSGVAGAINVIFGAYVK